MNKIKLSKTLSYILRHNPKEFDLTLDEDGYADIDILIMAIVRKECKYRNILTKNIIIEIVKEDEKGRYEIKDNLIRAVYGHSIKEKVEQNPCKPPKFLYHGTTLEKSKSILTDELKSMDRQYVHLSEDIETANKVALRRTNKPVILKISAEEAFKQGIKFYKAPNGIWLSESINNVFIDIVEE